MVLYKLKAAFQSIKGNTYDPKRGNYRESFLREVTPRRNRYISEGTPQYPDTLNNLRDGFELPRTVVEESVQELLQREPHKHWEKVPVEELHYITKRLKTEASQRIFDNLSQKGATFTAGLLLPTNPEVRSSQVRRSRHTTSVEKPS